jgi:hypothetical protein
MPKRIRGLREHLWYAKRDARNRGIAWQIKDQDALALFTQECFWCGAVPAPVNGLDRKNNERYYRKSNVVACCWPCNRAKGAMKERMWAALCERIALKYWNDDYAALAASFEEER